jgi:4-amino-4-deoxy-L-arabinose transferase-like glycosyltransferase
VWIPLAWVLLTVLFFSISKGKRGIYVFPALPALALAAAPFLPDLFRRRGVRALSLVLAGLLLLPALVLLAGHALQVPAIEARLAELDADAIVPLAIFLAAGLIVWLIAWRRAPLIAWPGVVACLAIVVSYGIAPQIDSERSARGFMQSVLRQVPRDRELAFAGYKEQFLLYLDRPVVNFGHRRWLEGPQESYDAALWLNSGAGRTLLIRAHSANPCFSASPQHSAGRASGDDWLLVEAPASADCAARGNSSRTLRYVPLAKPEG